MREIVLMVVGIFYLLLSTLPIWVKKFMGVQFDKSALRLYQFMGVCGYLSVVTESIILIWGVSGLYFDIISFIPVAAFSTYAIVYVWRTLNNMKKHLGE